MEKSGKWWEARTAAGRKGSMYFFLLLSFCPFLMKFYFFFKKKKSCAFKLFTIANLTTTIYFFFPLLPPFCNGWMFSVSLKRCDFDFFFFVFKDSNFFFFLMPATPFFLPFSVIRQDMILPVVHFLTITIQFSLATRFVYMVY